MSVARYTDRREAGQVLAAEPGLARPGRDTLVLGLPRGGVPVAAQVARILQAPLDIVVVRKLGFPSHPELAMGAIACAGGILKLVRNPQMIAALDQLEDGQELYQEVLAREQSELVRRDRLYRSGRPAPAVLGRDVIVVDDGLATGASMRAALAVLKPLDPARITVAAPVGAEEVVKELAALVEEVICPWQPSGFESVAQAYRHFDQTSDAEVRSLLATGSGTPETTT